MLSRHAKQHGNVAAKCSGRGCCEHQPRSCERHCSVAAHHPVPCLAALEATCRGGVGWCVQRGGQCVPECIPASLPPAAFQQRLRHALLTRSPIVDRAQEAAVSLVFYRGGTPRPVQKQGKAVQSYHVLAHSLLFHLRAEQTVAPTSRVWLEFGVAAGFSLNATCRAISQRGFSDTWRVHGFDTFEGLPEAWTEGLPKGFAPMEKGHFSQGGRLPRVAQPCGVLHKGLINATLPRVLEGFHRVASLGSSSPLEVASRSRARGATRVAGMSIDVDLYTGTVQALQHGFPLLRPQALLHFHELGHSECCQFGCPAARTCWPPGKQQEEARALHDYLRKERPNALLALLPTTGPPGQPEQAAALVVVRTGS